MVRCPVGLADLFSIKERSARCRICMICCRLRRPVKTFGTHSQTPTVELLLRQARLSASGRGQMVRQYSKGGLFGSVVDYAGLDANTIAQLCSARWTTNFTDYQLAGSSRLRGSPIGSRRPPATTTTIKRDGHRKQSKVDNFQPVTPKQTAALLTALNLVASYTRSPSKPPRRPTPRPRFARISWCRSRLPTGSVDGRVAAAARPRQTWAPATCGWPGMATWWPAIRLGRLLHHHPRTRPHARPEARP